MIEWLGIQTMQLGDQVDAGEGRRLWLSERIGLTDRVLDMGGTGNMLRPWHKGHVTALDDLSGFGPGHRIDADTFVRGDVERPPRELEHAFDVAVLAEVLEHCGQPAKAIAAAAACAERVLITTPCEQRWKVPIRFHVSGHIRFYFPEFFVEHLQQAKVQGTYGLLDFGAWSFLVAEVRRCR